VGPPRVRHQGRRLTVSAVGSSGRQGVELQRRAVNSPTRPNNRAGGEMSTRRQSSATADGPLRTVDALVRSGGDPVGRASCMRVGDEPSAISTAWLNPLRGVHLPPINQLV